jgi:hypothetical protein
VQVIDSTSTICHFCGATLDRAEMELAAASFTSVVEAKSRLNDRRSLRAAIIGLIGLVVFTTLWFTGKMLRMTRADRHHISQRKSN